MMQENNAAYLALEKALKSDHGGQQKQMLLNELNAEAVKVRNALNIGASPQEYQRLSKILGALESSTSVVEKMWLRFQKAS